MKNSIVLFIIFILLIFGIITVKKNQQNKPKNYNVIFITFDGLQAKHLNKYGYTLKTTPNLDQLLGTSYLFKNAVSPAPWTVPSHMSIMTSMYPSEHKVINKFVEFDKKKNIAVKTNLKNLTPSAKTFAEILKENGYYTAAFTGDAGVSAPFGFSQGFDEYYDKEMFGGFYNTIPKAIDWLKKNKDKKFFLWVHGYDVHGQHAPEEGYDNRYVTKPYTGKYTGSIKEQGALREEGIKNGVIKLSEEDIAFWRAIYDEKIEKADAKFKKLVDEITNLKLLDNTILVLFSDHGTEFYEHKRFDHGHTLYSELLNVLFAIHLPEQKTGKEINSLVSTLDIAPTVLKLLNIKNPVPEQTKGIDLTPSFADNNVSRDIFSETDYRLFTHKRSVQTPDEWKFIMTMNGPEKELYNLKNDPNEQENLAEKETKKAYELEQKVTTHLAAMKSEGPWILGCSPVYNDQCLDEK